MISVDPIALSYVLAIRGPIKVPPYPQTITASNVLLELDYIANSVRPGADPFTAKLQPNSGGAYRDYVRVYVPETAQLDHMSLSLNGRPATAVAPEDTQYEYQREAIAYWLIVPRDGDAELTLDYSGPFADASRDPLRYGLTWAKQVNALTWPIDVSVELPGGRRLKVSSDLNVDRSWEITPRG